MEHDRPNSQYVFFHEFFKSLELKSKPYFVCQIGNMGCIFYHQALMMGLGLKCIHNYIQLVLLS